MKKEIIVCIIIVIAIIVGNIITQNYTVKSIGILSEELEELKKDVQFSFWEKKDDTHTVVRFATSWATRMEDVEKLLSLL